MTNLVILLGRLTADPVPKYTQTGKCVCTFTLAVDDGYGENKTTLFIPIVTWNKLAEACGNNLVKGRRVLVDGRLQIRSYEAKDGSGKRWVTEIVANEVIFLEGKKDPGQSAQQETHIDVPPVAFSEEIPF